MSDLYLDYDIYSYALLCNKHGKFLRKFSLFLNDTKFVFIHLKNLKYKNYMFIDTW